MATPLAWAVPLNATSLDGLGGGLAWAEDVNLCSSLLDRFDAETFDYFGARWLSFINCEEITDALLRGFSTWSANHGRLTFFSVTHECATANTTAADCALAEIVVTSGTNPHGMPLDVTFETTASSSSSSSSGSSSSSDGSSSEAGDAPELISRVTLSFDSSSETCYYMDSTVCDAVRSLGDITRPQIGSYDLATLVGLGDMAFAYIIARTIVYLPALWGVFYFLWNVILLTMRSHRAGWTHCLFVMATLSHRWRLVTLLFALPPLIDWKMLLPCQRCVAFETLATHAAGRAMGLTASQVRR